MGKSSFLIDVIYRRSISEDKRLKMLDHGEENRSKESFFFNVSCLEKQVDICKNGCSFFLDDISWVAKMRSFFWIIKSLLPFI